MNKSINKISIVIPVYNEKSTVRKIIARVDKAKYLGFRKQIIVVDDGSTDGTAQIIKNVTSPKITKVFQKTNMGKGAALRAGFKIASGDIVVIQDADLEYDPDEIKLLLEPFIKRSADVVYGSRFITNRPHRVLYFWHSIGNNLITFLSNALTNLNLTDIETGYKAFRREVIKKILPKLESDRFGFEPEITARVAKLVKNNECTVYEVGISYSGRTYKEGKKITWRDGLAAIWYLLKFNLLQ